MEEEGFIELRLAARKLKSTQHEIVGLLRGSGPVFILIALHYSSSAVSVTGRGL